MGHRADAQWLLCLAAKDGKELWATRHDNSGGKKGAVIVLEIKTGLPIWCSKGFTDGAQYTSLLLLENGGVRQCISANRE